ncbi:MAG: FMN-binding protein [Ignavibacteriales bacterium]|nr:FMN-binding protein [Ignavibacteriales bacterium]
MNLVTKMLLTLTVIGIISGGFLMKINEWAEPKIDEHRKTATEEAIFKVQQKAKSYEKVNVDKELYKVYDENKNPIGFALPFVGNGFQGKIRVIIGIADDLEKLTGIQVLEQVETPGLGTKIVEDPSKKGNEFWFPNQFIDLSVKPEIKWIKGIAPDEPNEVEAITGATISSKSLIQIINNGIEYLQSLRDGGKI